MLKICFSSSYVTKSLQEYSRKMSPIGGRYPQDTVLIWVFYCIPLRDLLAKLNIKHRLCRNRPIDYKMLTKFFLDVIAWLYGKGGNSHILAI